MKNPESGFIAIISVTIIAVLLMTVAFALGTAGFFARADIADSEYKTRSLALAEGCADDALAKRAANSTYTGNETLTIGTEQCSILAITTAGSLVTIKTSATVMSATTNLRVTANATTLVVATWEQAAN